MNVDKNQIKLVNNNWDRMQVEMEVELKALQERVGITFVCVTHDQEEALEVADRVVVLDQGEIIADGKHVHPDLIRLLVRDKPSTNIVLVTDALKPTEQKAGPFFANREEVVLSDGLFLRAADRVIAGSSLTMVEGLKNLVDFGIALEIAVKMAASNPARILKLQQLGEISPGFFADLTLLSPDFNVIMSMVRGRFVFGA